MAELTVTAVAPGPHNAWYPWTPQVIALGSLNPTGPPDAGAALATTPRLHGVNTDQAGSEKPPCRPVHLCCSAANPQLKVRDKRVPPVSACYELFACMRGFEASAL